MEQGRHRVLLVTKGIVKQGKVEQGRGTTPGTPSITKGIVKQGKVEGGLLNRDDTGYS